MRARQVESQLVVIDMLFVLSWKYQHHIILCACVCVWGGRFQLIRVLPPAAGVFILLGLPSSLCGFVSFLILLRQGIAATAPAVAFFWRLTFREKSWRIVSTDRTSMFVTSIVLLLFCASRYRTHLMPCISMFSRFKADRSGGGGCGGGGGGGGGGGSNGGGGSSSPSQILLEGNAITTFFEIGRQTATAGPGYLWKVHDAYRKSDGKVYQLLNCRKFPPSLVQ